MCHIYIQNEQWVKYSNWLEHQEEKQQVVSKPKSHCNIACKFVITMGTTKNKHSRSIYRTSRLECENKKDGQSCRQVKMWLSLCTLYHWHDLPYCDVSSNRKNIMYTCRDSCVIPHETEELSAPCRRVKNMCYPDEPINQVLVRQSSVTDMTYCAYFYMNKFSYRLT